MKKWMLIILPILVVLCAIIIYFYLHSKKIKFKDFNTLNTELETKAESFESLEDGTKKFNFSKGSCNIFISIAGSPDLRKADLLIFFKSIPFRSEDEIKKEIKEQEVCLNFGMQTFTVLFEDKKTKQEFFKLSKKLLSEFKSGQTLKSKFHQEELTIKTENGELKISLN